jgi:alpha-tubulin suppressor-like RCC1 family protein
VAGGHAFSSLTVGSSHTCGVRADGQALCWGFNGSGRLGDGTTAQQIVPALVVLPASVAAFATISAGGFHTCAVDVAGLGFCWGLGTQGALGNGATGQQVVATPVAGGLTFARVAAGLNHTCGIDTAGAVYCWGANGGGRLGDGTLTNRTSPARVARGITATALAPGDEHTCVRTTFGSALCWGRGQEGQVGDGSSQGRSEPVGVTPP